MSISFDKQINNYMNARNVWYHFYVFLIDSCNFQQIKPFLKIEIRNNNFKFFFKLFDNLHKKALFLRSKIGDSIYLWINNILIRDMYLTSEKKQELFKSFGTSEIDTGTAEGQIALFSYRINHLTEHLKKNKKDFSTQQALIKLVGKRRRLLDYLRVKDIGRYREIIKALKLRK